MQPALFAHIYRRPNRSHKFRMSFTVIVPQTKISTIFILVMLRCLFGSAIGSCPEGYDCHMERETYVLKCKLFDNPNQMNVAIDNVPTNATKLTIKCTQRRPTMNLTFGNLSNIQQLTLDNLNMATWGGDMFQGITNIYYLVMTKLPCNRLDNDFFTGLTNLRSLEIEHFDELEHIQSDVLAPLKSLQSLSFRFVGCKQDALNYSDYGRMLHGINSTNFHKLVLYAIHSVQHKERGFMLTDLFIETLSSYSIRYLDIGRNNLDYIWGNITATLPCLEYVSLHENVIIGSDGAQNLSEFWASLFQHPRLKVLDLSGMNSEKRTNKYFNLNLGEDCSMSLNFTLGASLESVTLRNSTFYSNSEIPYLPICLFDQEQSLKYIDASNMRGTVLTVASLAGVRGVEYMNIQNYNFRQIPTNLFNKMHNMTMLLLGENDIKNNIANDIDNIMFYSNNKLRTLDLAACRLTYIPNREFSNLQRLQHLNLSRNALTHFSVDIDDMKRLRRLYLNNNTLQTLADTTRKSLDKMEDVQVDLSGNPLRCICINIEFVKWVQSRESMFLNRENTYCTNKNNATIPLFIFDSETLITECEPTISSWYLTVLLPIAIAFVVVIMLIVCVSYRYRWKFAYCCRRIHVYKPSSANELDRVVYERDAFICYNSSDRAWVCDVLLKRLEDNNVSTIIHQRDFLPGRNVHELILESIDKCRYTVLVFSPDFIDSEWCQMEINFARHRIITQGRDVIVPIILREFPRDNLSRTLVGILEKSYLPWPDNPDEQEDFWSKLITKLKRGGNIKPLEV